MEIVNGILFSTKLPESMVTREQAKAAVEQMRSQAADMREMSLGEINAEISAARSERKAKKKRAGEK